MINPVYKKIGNGKPEIAVVACLHGDEIVGKKVINRLKGISLKKGSITFITAHPEAVKEKKRYLESDLNRSFPGNTTGTTEEKIASQLTKVLNKFDLVIDIHATNSNFKELAIIINLEKKEKDLLKLIPISKIALIKNNVFGGREMINYCKLGISLDYGPDKTGTNAPLAERHIKTILRNLEMISGPRKLYSKKELYVVEKTYPVPENFIPNSKLKNFIKIVKDQIIGTFNGQPQYSEKTFYPLFLGKGRYEKTLALVSKKRKLNLDNGN